MKPDLTPVAPVRVLELRSVRGTGGGPEKTILLGAAQAAPDVAITVCYVRDQRDEVFAIDRRASAGGVEYVEIPERHSLDLAVVGRLRELVRARSIDVVHAHDYKTDLLAWWLSRSAGTAALATAHGWTGHSARERLFYYPADKRVLRRFPLVVAVSSEVKAELVERGCDPARVRVLLNGIDHVAFRRDTTRVPDARASLGLRDGQLAIGAVGRLEPQKRFDLLIAAFDQLRQAHPEAHLLIAGDGSLRDALQAQIDAQGLGHCCRLLGHLDDVRPLHHGLDLFVQSSDYEGTPNAVLEAMALETPIVATDAGGTRELVEDGRDGSIVPCSNLEALVTAMKAAIEHRAATTERAAAARRRVETVLSFERRQRALETIYRDLASRQRAS